MPSTGEIVARMRQALRLADPNLDSGPGTVARKILDIVGEGIAEAYSDEYLLNFQYDIDSKVEGDLDDFVSLFGISRLPAQRAVGSVIFSRINDNQAATTSLVIPVNTQVVAITNPLVYVQTTVSAAMAPGELSVEIPVQALVAGPQGNVAAGLLINLVGSVPGITTVTNETALINGSPAESDTELRARFKRTVFRSLAGTEAMYRGVALEVPQSVDEPLSRANNRVNVVGSSQRYREQIAVVSGTASTVLPGAAYIYADNVFCGPDIDAGQFLVQGVHFSFVPTNPAHLTDASATLTSLNATVMPDGVYDLVFEYVSESSRNDPANTRFATGNVNNRVDVWADGEIQETATQTVVFSNAITFNNTTTSPYWRNLFTQSTDAADFPTAGWIYIPLSFGPILNVPASIVISSTTYTYGTHYRIVEQRDCFGYAPNSKYGLVWNPTSPPANGSIFSVQYTYNRVAHDVQQGINNWRLLGTDAVAHAGVPLLLKFNFAMIYDRRYEESAVNTAVDSALAAYVDTVGFGRVLTVSDVLTTVNNVPGVENVRFLTSTDDPVAYAISRMSRFNPSFQVEVFHVGGRATDYQFRDRTVPRFHATRIIKKATNNFGQG